MSMMILMYCVPWASCPTQVDNADGSYINMADVKLFPVATDMAGEEGGGSLCIHAHTCDLLLFIGSCMLCRMAEVTTLSSS